MNRRQTYGKWYPPLTKEVSMSRHEPYDEANPPDFVDQEPDESWEEDYEEAWGDEDDDDWEEDDE